VARQTCRKNDPRSGGFFDQKAPGAIEVASFQ
jgi:hypothetical protein